MDFPDDQRSIDAIKRVLSRLITLRWRQMSNRLSHSIFLAVLLASFLLDGTAHAAGGEAEDARRNPIASYIKELKHAVAGGRCLPPREVHLCPRGEGEACRERSTLNSTLLLGVRDGTVLGCPVLDTPDTLGPREPLGCWRLAVPAGKSVPYAETLPPGYSVTGDACAHWGLCRKRVTSSGQQDDQVVASADGRYVAVIESGNTRETDIVALYDASTRKPLRKIGRAHV